MELNEKNLSELWDKWQGSEEMLIPKTLERPVNFLGSSNKYKKSLLEYLRSNLSD